MASRFIAQKEKRRSLVWGQLISLGGRTVSELRFVSTAEDGANSQGFELTNKLTLEKDFGYEIGAALVGVQYYLLLLLKILKSTLHQPSCPSQRSSDLSLTISRRLYVRMTAQLSSSVRD